MGVIKRVLYRGDILTRPRHRNLFLDMEENIHIHYRDLRIELSRNEFEDFVRTFTVQSRELTEIIDEQNYRDGKFANANQNDVRIWTESRLRSEVKYHPTRLSIEECGDGYHIHYRNCKFLVDPEDFHRIAALLKSVDLDAPYAETHADVLELLEANEVDFVIDEGNAPPEKLAIKVAKYHLPKVRELFNYIKFAPDDSPSPMAYQGSQLRVEMRSESKWSSADYRRMRGLNEVVRIADHLARHQGNIDPNEINRIKCQMLDLYGRLEHAGSTGIETDVQKWLYDPRNMQVIFPFSQQRDTQKTDLSKLYREWNILLNSYGMSFIKPGKTSFDSQTQKRIQQKIQDSTNRLAAAFSAVTKIHIMGSAARSMMGIYEVPFIHGKLAKLGSDVDLLVEIDPKRESDIPRHWKLYNPKASNHCAIYHLGQIPLAGTTQNWKEQFPNVTFLDHLLDAYVYLPSSGNRQHIDAFLHRFSARCIYERNENSVHYFGEQEQRLADKLTNLFGFNKPRVEPLNVSTENGIFLVVANGTDYILKLFKVSGNYRTQRLPEHVRYEQQLIEQLRARGISTPAVVRAGSAADMTFDGNPLLLFERQRGMIWKRPEYPTERIAKVLAELHAVQMKSPLPLPTDFTFDELCMIWLPQFAAYADAGSDMPEVSGALRSLEPRCEPFHNGEFRGPLYATSPFVHCHGDVAPKNVIIDDDGCAHLFDFNNAYYGPRITDVLDGAFEFSLAEKYIHLADFKRFDRFIESYHAANPLNDPERNDLARWIDLTGIIKFTKELKAGLEANRVHPENLRIKRAVAIANFLNHRTNIA
ncbi:phosphotransferase [Thiohalocapsa marina]|uniref:Phosphotransferase n=1 Tax=Thiohalocapsa marina TaxID=424902 RepID=A0A5M8FER7_9GAMM|nr:phosphotransferase [Thiohalocapsa marina]KAA6181541.1 phosphotransferase [Thiohalocapsa marina]